MEVKIGVISDTHYGPETGLPDNIKTAFEGAELILHAGDINFPKVLRELSALAPVEAVLGNTDPLELDLPQEKDLQINGVCLTMTHGGGTPLGLEDRLGDRISGADVIVYGHTHVPRNHWKEDVLFFNPGSASLSKSPEWGCTVGMLEISDQGEINGRIIRL